MLSLTVTAKTPVAEDILELELSPDAGVRLPGFVGGAHIDLNLAQGLTRQYSLVNPGDMPASYRVAVARDANSRGGSVYVHDTLKVGQRLDVSEPRNNFPLNEEAHLQVFIGGGIGITPMIAMIRHCEALGHNWRLVYAARSPARCAYYEELKTFGDKVIFHFDSEAGGPLDVPSILPEHHVGTHIYCCGPVPMMNAVKDATIDCPKGHVHFEWFSADHSAESENEAFDMVISSTGKKLHVPAEKTALEVLRAAGIPCASVCSEGVCGTCETYVLSGEIDHRDKVLTDEEKDSNEMMMVCCSRGRGEIVLDL